MSELEIELTGLLVAGTTYRDKAGRLLTTPAEVIRCIDVEGMVLGQKANGKDASIHKGFWGNPC